MTVIGLAKSKVRRIGVKIGVYRWNSQNQNMPKTYQIPKLRIGDINRLYLQMYFHMFSQYNINNIIWWKEMLWR